MGRLNHDQGELFYSFCLEKVVPDDHLVRKIAAFLDLGWVRVELAPYYSSAGRPSIDDPDVDHWLCVCDPLGAVALPRAAGQPGVSVVLPLEY